MLTACSVTPSWTARAAASDAPATRRRLVHPEEHWIVHATEAAAEVLGQFAAAQAAYNVDVRLIVDQPQVRVVGVGRWDDRTPG